MVVRRHLALLPVMAASAAFAQDLGSMSIEDLMKIKVSTASRQAEALDKVPAAIFVLTAEDIARSGTETLPDMLRLVPGVQVGIIDANKFQVSIRGFGGRYTNKLQVLIDGRSIYTPLFSGVFWESNMVSPSEVERIEVVRGPGGALWGPNALNGVINVITKAAEGSEEGHISLGAGDPTSGSIEASASGKAGEDAFFRVYARHLRFTSLERADGRGQNSDGWRTLHGAARIDWKSGAADTFTLNARVDAMDGSQISSSPTFSPPFRQEGADSTDARGYSLTGAWNRRHSETDESEARVSFTRHSGTAAGRVVMHTSLLDAAYQRTQSWGQGARLVWGANLRRYTDSTTTTPSAFLNPSSETDVTYSAFAQVDVPVAPKVRASFGLTAEHNEYTGFEFQPSARALWEANDRASFWASASRAVRTPNRGDSHFSVHYITVPGQQLPNAVFINGSEDFKSEELIAFEVGGRFRPNDKLFVDVTAFFNLCDRLRGVSLGTPVMAMNPAPHVAIPGQMANTISGQTGGLEAYATYTPSDRWRLDGSMTLFSDSLKVPDGPLRGANVVEGQGSTPRFQATLRSHYALGSGFSLDAAAYHVGEVSAVNIPAYILIDAGLTWAPRKDLSLSLFARDIFGRRRQEATSSLYEVPSNTQRGISVRFSYRF